jgi:hypothetical protein
MSVDSGKELFRLGFLTAIEVPERGYVGGLLVTNQFGRPLEFQCTAPLKPNRTQEILYGPTLVPYLLSDLIGRTLIEKVGVKPHLVLTERQELIGLRELVEIPVACVDEMPANGQASPSVAEDLPKANSGEMADSQGLQSAEEPVPSDRATVAESVGTDVTPLEMGSLAEASLKETPAETSDGNADERKSLSTGTEAANGADDFTMTLGRQMLRFHAGHAGDRSVASRGARVVPNNADLREPFERVREALSETARLGGAR